jgi:hypothetical protein
MEPQAIRPQQECPSKDLQFLPLWVVLHLKCLQVLKEPVVLKTEHLLVTANPVGGNHFQRISLPRSIHQQLKQCLAGKEHPSLEWDLPCSTLLECYRECKHIHRQHILNLHINNLHISSLHINNLDISNLLINNLHTNNLHTNNRRISNQHIPSLQKLQILLTSEMRQLRFKLTRPYLEHQQALLPQHFLVTQVLEFHHSNLSSCIRQLHLKTIT